jgi:hypothetical protein
MLYWYLLYPVHRAIFSALVGAVGQRASGAARGDRRPRSGPEA